MPVKRVMLIAVVASAVMLAVGISPRLAAQEPDPPG
jgi:hypothetical protein